MKPLTEVAAAVAAVLGIDKKEIARRKAFFDLTETDVELLKAVHGHMQGSDTHFVDEFYAHLLRFDETRRFIPDTESLERLKRTQSAYFESLTAGDYGSRYVSDRLRVGVVHQRIGLEPKWYIGAYGKYLASVLPKLWDLLHSEPQRFLDTYSALQKIILFDMSLAIDTYIHADQRAILGLKQYAEDMIASLPTGLVVLDESLRVHSVNHSFRELFGLRNGDNVAGQGIEQLLPLPGLREQALGVLASGTTAHGIKAAQDGKWLRLAIAGIPLAEEYLAEEDLAEKETRLLLTVEDVTEEQRLRDETEIQDKELRRINRALRTLSAGNRSLMRAVDEPSLLQKMCSVAVEIGGYRIAWVGFAEHDAEKTVRPVAQAGIDKAFLDTFHITWDKTERGNGPTGTAIRTGRHCVAHGLQSDPRYQAWHTAAREQGIETALSLPLLVDQEVMGAMTIYAEDDEAFDTAEIKLLSEMAEDLAYGIATLRTRIEHDAAQVRIQRMAYYDALTGLPNHASLEAHLEDAITGARSQNHSLALLWFDLQRLRDINRALGFEAGNKVMQIAAQRMAQETEKGEFVARMHGDEFALLLPEADADRAEQTALRILALLNQPVTINDFPLVVRANVGVVLFPEHGTDGEQLMRHADLTHQLASMSGNGYAFYSPEQDVDKKRHLALASDLNRALEDNALELYYQPKICMNSGHVNGFEALARWSHPTHGMVPPDEFIALAECTGMIRALTDWVLASALRQSTALRQAGIQLPIAVNLSAINLQDPHLLEKIQEMSAASGVEKGMLELEITESAIMADPAGALDVLTRLNDLGMPLYIDDFGTGYSSLSYLKKLPVTTLKIDQSFIADMLDDANSASIVRSTITLAHDMALTVVAEGVEDEAVWAQLKALGCDAGQGYYMGRPMPASQVETWLHESPWGLAGASQDK